MCGEDRAEQHFYSPHFEHPVFTTPQMTFGLNPLFPIFWALLMARKIGPAVTRAAVNQVSIAV
jgi:hypothetical protein